eukprot:2421765-Prymnesium_polylepis.1
MDLLDDVMSYDAGRVRMPVQQRLSSDAQALCDRLFVRALASLGQMPEAATLLDDCVTSAPSCLCNPKLAWSPGEPAVNVYAEGGEFKPHEDEQSLTMLVPLVGGDAFTGGGTAFWPARGRAHEDENGQRTVTGAPSFVLTPPAGTALLFGGQVTHAAQSVVNGERCVLVGSFTPTCG